MYMFYRILSAFAILSVLFFTACLGVLFYASEQPWVDLSVLEHYNPGTPSVLLDDAGKEWARFELEKREIVRINKIPKCVIQAFLAAEDWQFFSHGGLSYKGIIRSAFVNMAHLRKAQGASTITQQLVRLLYFETKKSYVRKIQEQILAIVVERQFTKEQILETYLNHIYLGGGLYGVEAACQRFWGISVTDCSVDQAAVLAAIVRCPREYCPLYNLASSKRRRDLVLYNMRKLNFIGDEKLKEAQAKPVSTEPRNASNLCPHLKETLRLFLEELVGKKKLYTGGLRIQTTLNKAMQQVAERVFKEHCTKLRERFSPQLEGALICIDGSTGGIKALVGGTNFSTSQFNRALTARRQLGSTFKPLIYAQALIRGKTFLDKDIDEPITLVTGTQEWTPSNANEKFKGPITLAHALSHSNNIVTIKTFLNSGPEDIVKLAQSVGLNALHPYPSLALGCLEATPLQSAAMMNVFAHEGRYVEPYSIEWVKDSYGTKLYRAKSHKKQVLPHAITSQVAQVLSLRIDKARTQNPELFFTCDALGKTGTTNDARTCWFVGSTPSYTTAIYIGFDDNRSLGEWAYGSRTAFPIWREFNASIKQPQHSFSNDLTLTSLTIHSITGEPTTSDDPNAVTILVPR